MAAEPTGREAVLPITTLLTMQDGRCVERWSTADMFGLMIQLGAIEAPPGSVARIRSTPTHVASTLDRAARAASPALPRAE